MITYHPFLVCIRDSHATRQLLEKFGKPSIALGPDLSGYLTISLKEFSYATTVNPYSMVIYPTELEQLLVVLNNKEVLEIMLNEIYTSRVARFESTFSDMVDSIKQVKAEDKITAICSSVSKLEVKVDVQGMVTGYALTSLNTLSKGDS